MRCALRRDPCARQLTSFWGACSGLGVGWGEGRVGSRDRGAVWLHRGSAYLDRDLGPPPKVMPSHVTESSRNRLSGSQWLPLVVCLWTGSPPGEIFGGHQRIGGCPPPKVGARRVAERLRSPERVARARLRFFPDSDVLRLRCVDFTSRFAPHTMPPAPTPRPGLVELEFGVPIPGVILEEAQWARTALKRLPEGIWTWDDLFGRQAEVVIDLGCGNGRSTLHLAVNHPEWNVLGIDILPVVIRYATRRANQRGLAHARLAVIGGRELLERHVAPHSVSELHCYHPQPFYDPREVGRRLITPEFLSLAHRALVPGGKIVLQTDHPGYWKYIGEVVPKFFEWQEQPGPWPDSPQGRTRREIMARSKGLPIFRGWGTARRELSEGEAIEQARQLPPPTFEADRRLQSLDQLERDPGDSSAVSPQPARRRSRGSPSWRRR